MSEQDKKKRNKKIKTAVIATTAATSLIINQTFDDPMDIINNNVTPEIQEEEDFKENPTFKDKVRKFIRKLPIALRIIFVIPLWIIGWLLVTALSKLWFFGLKTVVAKVCYWLVIAAAVFSILFIAKEIFLPDVKLKDMFNGKTIILVSMLIGLLAVTDTILERANTFYQNYQDKIKFAYLLLTILTTIFIKYLNYKTTTITMETDYMQVTEKC